MDSISRLIFIRFLCCRPTLHPSGDRGDVEDPLRHVHGKRDELLLLGFDPEPVQAVEDQHGKHGRAFVAVDERWFRIRLCSSAAALVSRSG